jgi:hypothetical protein
MKHSTLFFAMVLLGLGSCASVSTPPDPDYLAVARIALAGPKSRAGSLRLVVGPEIGEKARAALVALGGTLVADDAIPRNAEGWRAQGYTYVIKFDVTAEQATFEQTSDPVCGVGSKLDLTRVSGEWKIVGNWVHLCTMH